ncbi:lysoplasmalogenase [Streptomyces solincola]|uniref:lysoplasmalogenase n=1 Tax=Streptomyces solincola TaxID=2100817 RepID=UPI002158F1D5|nr:lysoplasmalogenase [Streptomyces solincola]
MHLWRTTGRSHPALLAALGFAAAGDTALLLPGPVAFAVGLGLFLGAQLCLITAFVRAGALALLRRRPALCAGYAAVWAAANAALATALAPAMAAALACYSLALVAMAATAHAKGPRAAWGGALFTVSDLLIGLGAAGADFTGRSLLVMPTYTAALLLLTLAFTAPDSRRAPGPSKDSGHAKAPESAVSTHRDPSLVRGA